MFRAFVSKLIRRSPLRWYIPNKVTRIEIIQRAISTLGAQRYLEIGVEDGICFFALNVAERIGVDPIAPSPNILMEMRKSGARYLALKSDDFFKNVAPKLLANGVDVVFIDGLHTYAQAYRDCINSLNYLNSGGLILLHDCLPASEREALVAENNEEAEGISDGIARTEMWTGDVWKAIVRLRAQHTELQTHVLHSDHGIGLVYKAPNNSGLSLTTGQIETMTYADLAMDTNKLLGLRLPRTLMATLKKLSLKPRE